MQDRFRFRCWRKLDNRMVEIYWFNPILFDEDAAGDRAKNYVLMQKLTKHYCLQRLRFIIR